MRAFHRSYWALEQRIVPGLQSSQYEYYQLLEQHLRPGARWLDTGCGHQLFPEWMVAETRAVISKGAQLTGIDLDKQGLSRHPHLQARVFGDLTRLPFAAEMFDIVTANMVVEHLSNPLEPLREIKRVLAPGGVVVVHTVNRSHWAVLGARVLPDRLKRLLVSRLENRPAEDVFKTYYRMNSAAAMRRLAAGAELEMIEVRRVSGTAVLAALGLLSIPELLWIRLLRREWLAGIRSNLLGVFRKPATAMQ